MRIVVRSAALIAFSIACGYAKLLLFPYLFFVELFTLALFVSGVIVGPGFGLWVGVVARLVFSLANPLGPPHPWVLVAQVLAGGFVGLLGGFARTWLLPPPGRAEPRVASQTALLAAGAILSTVAYDVLTNVAQGIAFGSIPVALAAGLLPALQHLFSNLVLFVLVGNLLAPWLRRNPLGARDPGVPAAAVLAVLVAAASPAAAQDLRGAAGDSLSVGPPAQIDSTRAKGGMPELLRWTPGRRVAAGDSASADSLGTSGAPPVRRIDLLGRIDLQAGRGRGVTGYEEALLDARPVWIDRLPVYGASVGAAVLPDGGGRYRPGARAGPGDAATDRPLAAFPGISGIPDLAATAGDPGGDGEDPLDADALETPIEPPPLEGPSGALTSLVSRAPADALRRAGTRLPRRFHTTLLYGKGDGGELVTGARFLSPTIGRGVYGSFLRRDADGTQALGRVRSTRYGIVAALPSVARRALSAEGLLLRRDASMPLGGGAAARAETERSGLTVRAAGRFGRRTEEWTASVLRVKRTDVAADGARARWDIPETSLRGAVAWGDSAGGRVLATARGATARIGYREGGTPAFRPRATSARLSLGARRPIGRVGLGADVACDLQERQEVEWDSRASAWLASARAAVRLDLESVHDRPSWIDLLSPARGDTLYGATRWVTFARSGDPELRARRLAGSVGRVAVAPARGVVVDVSGAVRHVTRDFGWDLSRAGTPDTIHVTLRAGERGDGWVSHASLRLGVEHGPFRLRALGWTRGGPDVLSPLAGSPPRRALDAELAAHATLFEGDLPAWLAVSAHATGARSGLVRSAAEVTWDAALRLDFGEAGVFLEYRNLFDRRLPSGTLDVESGTAEPLPGRTFRLGAVWNLID